jgi:hypothetical protein
MASKRVLIVIDMEGDVYAAVAIPDSVRDDEAIRLWCEQAKKEEPEYEEFVDEYVVKELTELGGV